VAGKTFGVAADASIQIDGKPGKLAGLPSGAMSTLTLSVDQKMVRSISAEGAEVGGVGGAVVESVDAARNTITVDIKDEGEKTFPVAKDAYIEIDGKLGTLAGVPKDAAVTLTLRVDQKTVGRIRAQSP
jgi:hypothetical protein